MELYTLGETSRYRFYKMPKELVENIYYRNSLTSDAKIVYTLLLDRMDLSKMNGWANDKGEIFLLYTKEDIAKMLNIGPTTVYKAFKQLEKCQLIKQERQGINKPNKIYVAKITPTFKNECSGTSESAGPDIQNMKGNHTNISDTDINNTNSYTVLTNSYHANFLEVYFKEFQQHFGKKHMRIYPEQLDYIDECISVLKCEDVDIEEWAVQVKKHFDTLPKSNNGNILAFLPASYRYFEVDLVRKLDY